MLGELPDGTYYIADILGLEVRCSDGRVLGVIDNVISTAATMFMRLKETAKSRFSYP